MYVYTAASQPRRWYTSEEHTKIDIMIINSNFFSVMPKELLFLADTKRGNV